MIVNNLYKTALSLTTRILLVGILLAVAVLVVYWQTQGHDFVVYDDGLCVTTNNLLMHNALGNVLAMQGKYDEAVPLYTEALRIRPEYSNAHYNLGHVLAIQKKRPQAIQRVIRAIQGKIDKAALLFQKALQLKPDYTTASINLDKVLQDLKKQ